MSGELKKTVGKPGHRAVYLLPNLITTLSLLAGFWSIIFSAHGQFEKACIAIIVAALFDALDGRVARLTGTSSPFGVQYDSLADLVSFGVAPSLLVYLGFFQTLGRFSWLGAFLFCACGALRLARFNVTNQKAGPTSFTGLPIPAAALIIASGYILFIDGGASTQIMSFALTPLVYLLAFLMVSTVPYPSFKQVVVPSHRAFQYLAGVVIGLVLISLYPALFIFIMTAGYAFAAPFIGAWLVRKVGSEGERLESYELEDEDILEEEKNGNG